MAYLGKSPSQGVRNRYYFTASGGETSISGAITGGTLTFSDGNYVDVTLNGVTLVAGTDYNTSTANTIAGLTALTASDVVEIVVYDVFSVFSGNVNSDFSVGGDLTVTGNTTTSGNINFGDNDKAIFGAGSDLQIYHDGSNSYIEDTGTGNLRMKGATKVQLIADNNEDMLHAIAGGAVEIYYDNAKKFETTSTGVDVTGTAVVDALTCSGSATIEGTSTFGTSSADTRFNFDGPNQYRAVFKHSGNIAGQIGGGGADELRFSNAAGAIVASITGGGITFNGDTAAANALDDYEEGTWTASYTGGGTLSGGNQTCRYTKIGNLVQVSGSIYYTSVSGGSGNLKITGFPFTQSSGITNYTTATIAVANWSSQAPEQANLVNTQLDLLYGGGTSANSPIQTSSLVAFAEIYFSISYATDS